MSWLWPENQDEIEDSKDGKFAKHYTNRPSDKVNIVSEVLCKLFHLFVFGGLIFVEIIKHVTKKNWWKK